MAALRDAGLMNSGTAGGGNATVSGGSKADSPVDTPPTLADADIDKHLADRARKLAAAPENEFDADNPMIRRF